MNNTHASLCPSFVILVLGFFTLTGFRPADDVLTISATATPSTCTNNGTITITGSGGSGNYKYKIQSPGLTLGPQDAKVFTGLPPSTYTATVFDAANGASASMPIVVSGNYVPMTLKVTPNCTALVAEVTGGAGPFEYSISNVGPSGPFGTGQASATFTGLAPATYWVRATDVCGNSVVTKIQFLGNPGTFAPYWFPTSTGIKAWANGAVGPLSFTLTTGLGVFTNATGEFSENLFDCAAANLLVTDGCQSKNFSITRTFHANLVCVSFQDGTATLTADGGVPPYIFSCTSGPTKVISPDGVFTGLPLLSMLYTFKVEDGCGQNKSMAIAPYSLRFPTEPVACDADTVKFWFERGCMRNVYPFPLYSAECTTCQPGPGATATATNLKDTIFVTGATPGNIVIKSHDNCQDEFTCRDTFFLKVIAACDSIVAQPIDSFTCSDGQTSRRLVSMEGMTFDLYGPSGTLLAAGNTTGVFSGFSQNGNYRVVAHTPCGDMTGWGKKVNPVPLNVGWKAHVSVRKNPTTGVCEHFYNLQIVFDKGSYLLLGGPNNVRIPINEEGAEWFNCDWFFEYDLPPGDYTLWSRTGCGSVAIPLPQPTYDLKATITSDCPGAASVKVEGAKTFSQWTSWAQSKGLSWYPEAYNNGFRDHYTMNISGPSPTSPYGGAAYTFYNLNPGTYSFYLYAHGPACPVDTATVVIPTHSKPTIYFPPAVVCDGQQTTNAVCQIVGGKGPYKLQQVDCNNLGQVLKTWQTSDTIISLPDLSLGAACFRLEDKCGNTADYNLPIAYINNNVGYQVICPDKLELSVDSLPASYIWRNSSGTIIGYGSRIVLPLPPVEETFSVSILLESCVVERSVMVPVLHGLDFQMTPAQDLVLCGSTSATISVEGADMSSNTIEWSNGQTGVQTLTVSESGQYSVTVTNSNGCSVMDTRNVVVSPVQTPSIAGSNQICEGETITIVAGGNFVQYSWQNGTALTPELAVSSPGTYTVVATDAVGCTWQGEFVITEKPAQTVSIAGPSEVCDGGSATLVASGNFIQYNWENGASNTATLTVHAPGTYTVMATDAVGCTWRGEFSMAQMAAPLVEILGQSQICAGQTTTLTVASAFSNYQWSGGQSSAQISVGSGLHSVTITDTNGCRGTAQFEVIENQAFAIALPPSVKACESQSALLQCAIGAATDSGTAFWTTGAGVSFTSDIAQGQTTLSFLPGAVLSVRLDSVQIPGYACGFLGLPATVEVRVDTIVPEVSGNLIVCEGSQTTLSGAAGFAQYLWSTGEQTPQIIVSQPGKYFLTVTDAKGCSGSSEMVEVIARALPVPEIVAAAPGVCPGQTTLLSVVQGLKSYSWSNGSETHSAQVGAGVHALTVTDAFGCRGTDIFTVAAFEQWSATLKTDPSTCAGDMIHAYCQTSDTMAMGQAFWTFNGGQKAATPIAHGQSMVQFLAEESVNAVRLDSVQLIGNECPMLGLPLENEVQTGMLHLDALPTHISCAGADDGKISLKMLGGTAPFNIQWEDGAEDAERAALAPGAYRLTVTDAHNCSAENTVNITEPEPLGVDFSVFSPRCFGDGNGLVALDGAPGARGKAQFVFNGMSPRTFPAEVGNLAAGEYKLHVSDAFCSLDTVAVLPESPSARLDFPEVVKLGAAGDSVLLSPSNLNELAVSSVAWSPAEWLSTPNDLQTWAHPTSSMRFKVEAWTPEGCHLTDYVLVAVDPTLPVYAPNAISLNSGTENERFYVFAKPSTARRIVTLRVFDRWGNEGYFAKDLPVVPGPTDGWDGSWFGKKGHAGVYVWAVEIEFVNGKTEKFSGNVTLIAN